MLALLFCSCLSLLLALNGVSHARWVLRSFCPFSFVFVVVVFAFLVPRPLLFFFFSLFVFLVCFVFLLRRPPGWKKLSPFPLFSSSLSMSLAAVFAPSVCHVCVADPCCCLFFCMLALLCVLCSLLWWVCVGGSLFCSVIACPTCKVRKVPPLHAPSFFLFFVPSSGLVACRRPWLWWLLVPACFWRLRSPVLCPWAFLCLCARVCVCD